MTAAALSIDPLPSAVEEAVKHLPAQLRADLVWYPAAIRSEVIEPIRSAPDWRADLGRRALTTLRLVARLGRSLAALTKDEHVARLLAGASEYQVKLPFERLESACPLAADQLRESIAWLHAFLPLTTGLFASHGAEVAKALQDVADSPDEELLKELQGELGAYLGCIVLVAAATEALLDPRPLPAAIADWCNEGFHAVHRVAGTFRTAGFPLPLAVGIPGFTPKQWRERLAARVLDGLEDTQVQVVAAAAIRR